MNLRPKRERSGNVGHGSVAIVDLAKIQSDQDRVKVID